MKRRLLLLNLVLVALIGWTASQLRQDWLAARARERALRTEAVKKLNVFEQTVGGGPAKMKSPADFFPIASHVLFSPDRSPEVVVEVPKPKPMPPLPQYFGAMDFGQGPTVVLKDEGDEQQKGYHLGDKVGAFKLMAITQEDILFDWDGKPVKAKLADLRPVEAPKAKTPARASGKSRSMSAAAAPSTPKRVVAAVQGRPAASHAGEDARPCSPGDSSPAGTVAEGYRKEIVKTPFSNICRWIKVAQ